MFGKNGSKDFQSMTGFIYIYRDNGIMYFKSSLKGGYVWTKFCEDFRRHSLKRKVFVKEGELLTIYTQIMEAVIIDDAEIRKKF
jgi:hypothetical protein